jgi:hypothetical protein
MFVGHVLAVVALLFGLLLMHGLSIAGPHDAAHAVHEAVATVADGDQVRDAGPEQSHAVDLLCLCACVLMAGIAGALCWRGLCARGRRANSPSHLQLAFAASPCARNHPPPPRSIALLSIALR